MMSEQVSAGEMEQRCSDGGEVGWLGGESALTVNEDEAAAVMTCMCITSIMHWEILRLKYCLLLRYS